MLSLRRVSIVVLHTLFDNTCVEIESLGQYHFSSFKINIACVHVNNLNTVGPPIPLEDVISKISLTSRDLYQRQNGTALPIIQLLNLASYAINAIEEQKA